MSSYELYFTFDKDDEEYEPIVVHTKNIKDMKDFIIKLKTILKKFKSLKVELDELKFNFNRENNKLYDGLDWYEMPEFKPNPRIFEMPFIQLNIQNNLDSVLFLNELNNIVPITRHPYIWFPERPAILSTNKGKIWISNEIFVPKYPIYIISKGRCEKRLTSKYLEYCNIDYKIVIEPQEFKLYNEYIDKSKILILPEKYLNKNQGGIPARNFCLNHSKNLGFKRHWILDDNIDGYSRLNNSERLPIYSGSAFKIIEDYVDRYENIKMAGHNYKMFAITPYLKPITQNTRIYSSILLSNDIPFEWRGRYNEDTDLSLRILKSGYATALFNCILANKVATLTQKGGNTDTIYNVENSMYLKAESLYKQHPDVVKIGERFGRVHHIVDYKPFKEIKYEMKKNIKLKKQTDNYGLYLFKPTVKPME
jgi:hypothetical protein